VLRGRPSSTLPAFLPDGLSKVNALEISPPGGGTLLSQVQGRTYANMFRLVNASSARRPGGEPRATLGDQSALEALVRFSPRS